MCYFETCFCLGACKLTHFLYHEWFSVVSIQHVPLFSLSPSVCLSAIFSLCVFLSPFFRLSLSFCPSLLLSVYVPLNHSVCVFANMFVCFWNTGQPRNNSFSLCLSFTLSLSQASCLLSRKDNQKLAHLLHSCCHR